MNLRHFITRLSPQISAEKQLTRMRQAWDRRATKNARYFVATAQEHWTDEEFYASGEQTVNAHILNDMENICQGQPPERMKILEIGCGVGRETRALARHFNEVHAVDISQEMVRRARVAVERFPNVFVCQNSGMDLSVIPGECLFDFAYSYLVFQHIPSREVIERYVSEVHRLLRPGSLFKFQLQGIQGTERGSDTWFGVSFSEEQVIRMAEICGFESRYRVGAGEQYFWNWFFKPQSPLPSKLTKAANSGRAGDPQD